MTRAEGDIARQILDLMSKLRSNPRDINRRLVLVSPSLEGNYTIVDGNKRCIALCNASDLTGNTLYVGVSAKIAEYPWAGRTISTGGS